jgi:hypothetical protein
MPSYGPRHVDEALAAARLMLAEADGLVDRAVAKRNIGKLLAMRGEIEAAREQVEGGGDILREAGRLLDAAAGAQMTYFVERRAGAPDVAEARLREGIAELEHLGNVIYRGSCALMLADLLATRGAYEEAARWCSDVRATLREDDLTDAIGIDSLEGFLAATAGDHHEGERLSSRAVEIAATIDMYDPKARAHEWHARTLAIVGKPQDAREAAATALAIYDEKGDIPASAWARELLDSLSG